MMTSSVILLTLMVPMIMLGMLSSMSMICYFHMIIVMTLQLPSFIHAMVLNIVRLGTPSMIPIVSTFLPLGPEAVVNYLFFWKPILMTIMDVITMYGLLLGMLV